MNDRHVHLMNQLAEMPTFLKAFRQLPRGLLVRQPINDKSPLIEHLWHTRDCEVELYCPRIESVISEDRPGIVPMSVNHWPIERGYHLRDGDQAIEEFSASRLKLIARLSLLTPKELERVAIRFDGSEVTGYGLIEQLADHDRDHRTRMSALLSRYLVSQSSDRADA